MSMASVRAENAICDIVDVIFSDFLVCYGFSLTFLVDVARG
jgi:hypothetical protein